MTTTQQTSSVDASLLKGVNYYFQDDDNEIRVFISMVSGKEIIHLNGNEVSNKRSLRTKTLHKFTQRKIRYEVEVKVTNILLGHIDCTIIKDGVHVETSQYSYIKSWKSFAKTFLQTLVVSFTIGFAVGYGLVKFIFDGG
jgi:hypothetical protein